MSPSRRGASILLDMVGACIGLATMTLLTGVIAGQRRDLARLDRRAADLETAQNLLDALRAGASPELPAGWTVERATLAGGGESITLVAP
nr:hypothetical protein [Planctomycetota bacterium]